MRVTPKQIVRFGLLMLGTAAFWSMGPVGTGVFQTAPALALPIGPVQIDRLGRGVALETYYDTASSAQMSAGGYGGPGHSGGAGDELVRLLNVGNFRTELMPRPAGSADASVVSGEPGALCANIYVFDDDQELQECCSCPVTADGVRTLSTINDLTSNPAFHNARMSVGAIKVVGSVGLCISPDTAAGLASIGLVVADPMPITGFPLAEGLKGWINHAEMIASNLPPSFAFVTSTSVEEFASAPLDSGELSELTTNCNAIMSQGSGAGICTCGSGDNGPVVTDL
jgi:hypothetical protein